MTVAEDWPLWPIEAEAVVLLHTQPVAWPDVEMSAYITILLPVLSLGWLEKGL
jgi:hypothetical protein